MWTFTRNSHALPIKFPSHKIIFAVDFHKSNTYVHALWPADYLARARNPLGCVCVCVAVGKKTWNINVGGREVLVTDATHPLLWPAAKPRLHCKSHQINLVPMQIHRHAGAELQNIFASHLFAASCLRTHDFSWWDGAIRVVDTRVALEERRLFAMRRRVNNAECAAYILMCIILECRDTKAAAALCWMRRATTGTATETHSRRAKLKWIIYHKMAALL